MPRGRKESRVMIRSAKALLIAVSLSTLSFAQAQVDTPKPDTKAGAYYNFAMGRVYAELAQAYGNKPEYLNKAIQHYQEALKLDPGASLPIGLREKVPSSRWACLPQKLPERSRLPASALQI